METLPHRQRKSPTRIAALVCLSLALPLSLLEAETSISVSIDEAGKLVYLADARGNTVPDFSRVGYREGEVPPTEVPVVRELWPQPTGDDGQRIQHALDEAGKLPLQPSGFRGAVLLKRGTYRVAESLAILNSGVVLRGEGSGEDGTVLLATGTKKRTFLTIGPSLRRPIGEIPDSRTVITDSYVPWSARTLAVEKPGDLKSGDLVAIYRPATEAWIRDLGMDDIPAEPDRQATTKSWTPAGYHFTIERRIVSVDGNRIILDAPPMIALDQKYADSELFKIESHRMSEAGVENIRFVSEFRGAPDEDEEHAWHAVSFAAVENAWARNLAIAHFSHGVTTSTSSKNITVTDCHYFDPVSRITGGRRIGFGLSGQYGLVEKSTTWDARHAFTTGSRARGPNAFVDCKGENAQNADSGPHHRFAIGTLYDNVEDRYLNAQNRTDRGSGQGWAGAQQVFWNCTAETMAVQQPPTAQNYAIGCIAQFVPGQFSPNEPPGLIESPGQHVAPRSLYKAQLQERLSGRHDTEPVSAVAQSEATMNHRLVLFLLAALAALVLALGLAWYRFGRAGRTG
jgi:hypothetical protein